MDSTGSGCGQQKVIVVSTFLENGTVTETKISPVCRIELGPANEALVMVVSRTESTGVMCTTKHENITCGTLSVVNARVLHIVHCTHVVNKT